MAVDGPAGNAGPAAPSTPRPADRFCDAVDRLNSWLGQATTWANETTIYLSACAYLVSGGYALAHRRHVRIDVIYDRLSQRTQTRLDLFTFLFFLIYVGALIWVGTTLAWGSFLEGEGTGPHPQVPLPCGERFHDRRAPGDGGRGVARRRGGRA